MVFEILEVDYLRYIQEEQMSEDNGKQGGCLSLSLDSGSILLVREHALFRDQYHRTGR